jgi:hypothetical protein
VSDDDDDGDDTAEPPLLDGEAPALARALGARVNLANMQVIIARGRVAQAMLECAIPALATAVGRSNPQHAIVRNVRLPPELCQSGTDVAKTIHKLTVIYMPAGGAVPRSAHSFDELVDWVTRHTMLLVDAVLCDVSLASYKEATQKARAMLANHEPLRTIGVGVQGGPRKYRVFAPTLHELESTSANKLRAVDRQRDVIMRAPLMRALTAHVTYKKLVELGDESTQALEQFRLAKVAMLRAPGDEQAKAAVQNARESARAAIALCPPVQLPKGVSPVVFVRQLHDAGAVSERAMAAKRRGRLRGDTEHRLLAPLVYGSKLRHANDAAAPAVPARGERHFARDLRTISVAVGADFIPQSGAAGGYLKLKGRKTAPKRLLEAMRKALCDGETGGQLFQLPEHFTSKFDTNHTKHTRTSMLNYNSKIELTTLGRNQGAVLPIVVLDKHGKQLTSPIVTTPDGAALSRIRQRDVSATVLQAEEAARFARRAPRSDALSYQSEIAERARYRRLFVENNNNHTETLEAFVSEWKEHPHCLSLSALATALHGVWQLVA